MLTISLTTAARFYLGSHFLQQFRSFVLRISLTLKFMVTMAYRDLLNKKNNLAIIYSYGDISHHIFPAVYKCNIGILF